MSIKVAVVRQDFSYSLPLASISHELIAKQETADEKERVGSNVQRCDKKEPSVKI